MRDQKNYFPCGCGQPVPPVPEPPRGGFLMQQIIGSGRAYLRYERFSLPLCSLPCDARQPVQLTAVSVQECGVRAERCDAPCGRGLMMQAHIPLCCSLCDACGCAFTASSHIDVPVQMRLCDPCQAERAHAAANACARLIRSCCCADGVADALLDVWVEVWLTACRPMYGGNCPPPCPPPLPLYPQPYRGC